MVTIDDLLIYNDRQNRIVQNLYHLHDGDKFSEITLLSCWHRNNKEMKSKLCDDMYAKDIYLQQIMMIAGYHEYRLNKHNEVKYATI